jgi:hypothetical protein
VPRVFSRPHARCQPSQAGTRAIRAASPAGASAVGPTAIGPSRDPPSPESAFTPYRFRWLGGTAVGAVRTRLSGPVIGCGDACELAEFFASLLGWNVVDRSEQAPGGWALVTSPTGEHKLESQREDPSSQGSGQPSPAGSRWACTWTSPWTAYRR